MIHMADLVLHRGNHSKFNVDTGKSIFNAIYQFPRRIEVKYHMVIVDESYANGSRILKQQLSNKINKVIKKHEMYFRKFDKIVIYYDSGQEY